MCVALVSALTKNSTKPEVAMTGEITLRGRILAVGGLKEKLLAAEQHGFKTVLVPKENQDDIDEILKDIKMSLKIILIDTMDEVLKNTLVEDPFKKPKKKSIKKRKKNKR